MDSFFKAAVCDLDKLLDDFELNTEELECKSVFLKPPVFPFSSLGSQRRRWADDREVKGQPLTAVDLLSSVDRRPAQSSAPPCPDRALKPVCDLVNDTSSAILVRANSHDAFSELDVVEKQMEEMEEEEEEEELLVDFNSPVVSVHREEQDQSNAEEEQASAGKDELLSLNPREPSGEYSASLSLLDVILPSRRGGARLRVDG
ncbi:Zinc finger FYVE domain-containing protein 16 Endofin Endosome-associated FYVE domain protein [Larimichthys crocea]|uniref:Zinc finger FYVE domain-containing protein 16 Endofin Endosome-associated FYVE domain protein n=1 Tax=Larimichthys crocea TaxID=215358 RepID=A0A6G0HDR4_LARCR|nr:Zinc finger FYVE domain-containing protein 16 Endofin Endosome-associated FYVE domain protein [Larimichthys crocea]